MKYSASEAEDSDYVIEDVKKRIKKEKVTVMSPELSAALDRTNVTDRSATFIVAAVASSLGHKIEDITVSRETIRKSRRTFRESSARSIQQNFKPETPLTIHWDGKLLTDLSGIGKVERTAILVTGNKIEKLLSVPKSQNSTGETQASAVFKAIEEWDLSGNISSMCFDTTASNTGIHAGACVLLEKKMNKKMLHLACRHHILELIVAKVHDNLFEIPTGPNIQLFNSFRSDWGNIDKNNYVSGMDDIEIVNTLSIHRIQIVEFINGQLKNHQQRNDYKELLNLVLIFFGEKPSDNYVILAPGAFHRARWMAKIIYCLKIYLFRFEREVDEKVLDALRNFNTFITIVYVKYWYLSPSSISAPRNDLNLVKDILLYRKVNENIANSALSSFKNHLWYINEKLIALAFFDPDVDFASKRKMQKNLSRPGSKVPLNRISVVMDKMLGKNVEDFVSSSTITFFKMLNLRSNFLKIDPSLWIDDPEYMEAQEIVQSLKVRDNSEFFLKIIFKNIFLGGK